MHLSPRGKENSDVMLFCCEKKRLQQPTRPTVSTHGRSQHIKYIHLNPLTLPDGSVRPAALCHFSMFYFSFQINSSSERDQSQDEGPRFWFCRDRQNVFEVVFSSLCHRRRKKDSERQKKKNNCNDLCSLFGLILFLHLPQCKEPEWIMVFFFKSYL